MRCSRTTDGDRAGLRVVRGCMAQSIGGTMSRCQRCSQSQLSAPPAASACWGCTVNEAAAAPALPLDFHVHFDCSGFGPTSASIATFALCICLLYSVASLQLRGTAHASTACCLCYSMLGRLGTITAAYTHTLHTLQG